MNKTAEDKKSIIFSKEDTLIVKGVAIMLMLFYHLFESQELLVSTGVNYEPLTESLLLTLSGFGNICVGIFIFLSAYGITAGLKKQYDEKTPGDEKKNVMRESMKDATKRCLKLILNFAIMYIFVNLLWFSHFDYVKLYGNGWQGVMLGIVDGLGLAQIFGTPTLNMTWWYMEIAILIVFFVPLLYPLVRKIGKYLIFPVMLLPVIFSNDLDIERHLLCMVMGMVACHEGWLEGKLFGKLKLWQKWIIGVVFLAISIILRSNYMAHEYLGWIFDAPITLLICWFLKNCISIIPGLKQVLGFLGKHSMNIFFVHTFFYMILFRDFIYAPKYAILIYLLCLAVSLAFSAVLELIKLGGKKLWGIAMGRRSKRNA